MKWEFYAFIDTNMWIYNEIKSIFIGKCDLWVSFGCDDHMKKRNINTFVLILVGAAGWNHGEHIDVHSCTGQPVSR